MEAGNNRTTLAIAAGLWLVTLFLFFPAGDFGFIGYDDGKYVSENEMVRKGLTAETIQWAFTEPHFHMWHPVTSLSHLLDVELFGMEPGAHHLVNIVIHSVNAVLLFLFLLRGTGERWASFFVAALFAWHPLRVESVVWISERKDVLCTLFWLLTLHAYLTYARRKSKQTYWLAVAVFALGIMTKPMIVTLPCVLLLLDFWPLNRLREESGTANRLSWAALRRCSLEKIPFSALSGVLAVLTYKFQKEGAVLTMMDSLSFGDRLANAMHSYVRYLEKLFWPVDLAVLYPHPGSLPLAKVAVVALVLFLVTLLAWWQRFPRPWLAVGWLWFIGIIVPASGVIQAGGQAMADRYTYVSTIGVLIAAVWAVRELLRVPSWGSYAVSLLGGVSVAGCLILTSRQIQLWRDTETLFRHTVRVTEKNSIATFILANTLLNKGEIEQAIQHFSAGLELNPLDEKAWLHLGRALAMSGEHQPAITAFNEALRIDRELEDARFELAAALAQSGQPAAAEKELLAILQKRPESLRAWNNLGNAQFLLQKFDAAEASYLQASRLSPNDVNTWMNLANLYLHQGNGQRGLEHLERALTIRPDDVQMWYQYAEFCEQYGAGAKAVAAYRKVLALDPARLDAAMRLAWRLSVDPAPAVRNGREALTLAEQMVGEAGGTSGPLAEILAAAKAESGLWTEAVFWAETAARAYAEKGDTAGGSRLQRHLESYRQKQPWRSATTP